MARIEKAKRTKLILLLGLLAAGVTLAAFPVSAQQNLGQPYTANYSTSAIDTQIGFAPPGYFTTAHISSGNAVTVTLTLVESGSQLFQHNFAAGAFDIPNIPLGQSSGTVFLAIQSQGGPTPMSVVARIFHEITAFPLFWAGLGLLGLAGIYAIATFHKEMGLGRILPIDKLGLYSEFESRNQPVFFYSRTRLEPGYGPRLNNEARTIR